MSLQFFSSIFCVSYIFRIFSPKIFHFYHQYFLSLVFSELFSTNFQFFSEIFSVSLIFFRVFFLKIFWKPNPHTFGHLNLVETCQNHLVGETLIPVLPTVTLVRSAWAPRTRGCSSLQVRGSPLFSFFIARPGASRPPHQELLTRGKPEIPCYSALRLPLPSILLSAGAP